MAFIICDDHNVTLEADGIGADAARTLIFTDKKENASAIEQEAIDFGQSHRNRGVRILSD